MVNVRLPRPIRWFWAALGAYWLGESINPGFVSVAAMSVLMLVLLIVDIYWPPDEIDQA